MGSDSFHKTDVTEYGKWMPYGELRIQRSIPVPEADAEKRLPTLEETTASLDKEWRGGKGFDEEMYRYESGIGHPITEEGLRAFNSFWFETKLLSHLREDKTLATRLITGWIARAESSSHYPAGEKEGELLITHGLAVFYNEKKMEIVKWNFDVHSHPGNSYRANMMDFQLSMQNSSRSFIVSESGILVYGGGVDITLDDLARLGIQLSEEDSQLLGQNVHIANSIDRYTNQLVTLAGKNYYKLNLLAGEDVEIISEYLGIPFRLYKWGSNEMADVLAYMNGDATALSGFSRKAFEDRFFATLR